MWADNPVTAYIVLGIGNLLGGVTKGVTGFGSAILNLCTWIVFVVAGVKSGTLQQAVVCEALASTLIAPGLLYVTRAHATADLKMVAAISLFVALSSPVGAAILAKLDSKRVELVMGAALLVIIVAEQAAKLLRNCRQQQRSRTPNASKSRHAQRRQHWRQRLQRQQQSGTGSTPDPNAAAAVDSWGGGPYSSSPADGYAGLTGGAHPRRSSPHMPLLDSQDASDCTVCLNGEVEAGSIGSAGEVALSNSIGSSKEAGLDSSVLEQPAKDSSRVQQDVLADDSYLEHAAIVTFGDVVAPQQHDQDKQHCWHESEQQPLLIGDGSGRVDSSSSGAASGRAPASLSAAEGTPTSSESSGDSARGISRSNSNRRHCWQVIRPWCVVFGIGSIAGTLSGIMEGLTGMNGPPIMFMYRWLNTPKATVRGNNAFLNLLQMRLVPYWYMGLIVQQDVPLYGVSCAAGVVGVLLGDRLSNYINQQVFQQVLGVLMVLCCVLMFASGLGFIE